MTKEERFIHRYVIAEVPTGYDIYVDLIGSSAGRYLSRQPYVINLIREALLPTKLEGQSVTIERDMGRVIGATDIVETSEKDTIVYAQIQKQTVFSRFAPNRHPSPSTTLTMLLEKDPEGHYELVNTWIGPCAPPFPGDEKANGKSKDYWLNHAFAQNAHAIQSRTITKDCPY